MDLRSIDRPFLFVLRHEPLRGLTTVSVTTRTLAGDELGDRDGRRNLQDGVKHTAGQPQADSVRDGRATATMDVEPSPDFYGTRYAMMAVPVK